MIFFTNIPSSVCRMLIPGIAAAALSFSVFADAPIGFASVDGGTTGGAGGKEVDITSAQQLADIMKAREGRDSGALICYISNTLTGVDRPIDVKRTDNVSFIGKGDNAKLLGFGFKVVEANNIIIRYLTIADCKAGEKDGISIESSKHVWVDHCTFTDSPSVDESGDSHDGQLDVKKGSEFVTLSYNYFTNHRKTCLMGHSEGETGDAVMKVTYVFNWFNGTYSRHPRVRFGKAHLLNNLYMAVGKPTTSEPNEYGYGIGVTCEAQVYVEANYFENTKNTVLISQVNDSGEVLSGDPAGYIKAANNYLSNSGAIVENLSGFNFDPKSFYSYTAMDAQLVKDHVMKNAGAVKIPVGIQKGLSDKNVNPAFFLSAYPTASVTFVMARKARASVSLYNMRGSKLSVLADKTFERGVHVIPLEGNFLKNGVYACKALIDGKSYTARMIVNK